MKGNNNKQSFIPKSRTQSVYENRKLKDKESYDRIVGAKKKPTFSLSQAIIWERIIQDRNTRPSILWDGAYADGTPIGGMCHEGVNGFYELDRNPEAQEIVRKERVEQGLEFDFPPITEEDIKKFKGLK